MTKSFGQMSFFRQRRQEFRSALTLLTRLPVSDRPGFLPPVPQGRAVWAYPLIGALIGAFGALVLLIVWLTGLPGYLCATAAVAAIVWLTGALHEDGLADFVDGIGGGRTVNDKLRIMRDSSIGAYGTIALIFCFAARILALGSMSAVTAVFTLMAAHGLARGLLVVPLFYLGPARHDGIAADSGKPGTDLVAGVLGLCLALFFCLLAPIGAASAFFAVTGGLIVMILMTRLADRQIGGYTGDALGASVTITEIAILWAMTAL